MSLGGVFFPICFSFSNNLQVHYQLLQDTREIVNLNITHPVLAQRLLVSQA